MKSLIAVLSIFFFTIQSQKVILINQQIEHFTKIQKEFVKKRMTDMQVYYFKDENLLAAYTDGYFECLSKSKIYSFEIKTYSENEYNYNIVLQNKLVGRLFLNHKFKVKSIVISDI